MQQVVFLVLQLLGVVVAQDVAQLCVGDIAVHLAQVVEALIALGGLRPCHHGQGAVELQRHIGGVDHGILGAARMDREAVDGDGSGSGVEILVLNAAHIAAIDGIGKVGPKAGDVKQGSALADLLVGGKGDADLAVGAALGKQGLGGGHDLSHTGLVVRTQQGGAVGGDKGLAFELFQERERGGLHDHPGGGQGHIVAVIVLVEDGVDVFAAGIRGSVHVGDEAQRGQLLAAGGGGQGAVDVAVLVHTGVLDAQIFHLLHQHVGEVELAGCGGVGAGFGIRGGIHPGVL